MTPPKTTALDCLEAAVAAANPERAVRDRLAVETDTDRLRLGDDAVDLSRFDRIVVAGGGKASVAVARGLESVVGERLDAGAVVTDDQPDDPGLTHTEVAVGDHPIPSERSVAGTARVQSLLDGATDRTLVLAPVTGGASALLCDPIDGISLDALRATNTALLESGAAIDEINAVRTRLSAVKGGGLARLAEPATVVSLLVSDVVGDDPATIASGPFVPDPATDADARTVLSRYDLDVPAAVRERLAGDTHDQGTDEFDHVRTVMLVTNRTAIDAASETAHSNGYQPLVLSTSMRGEAREIALAHVACAEECRTSGDPIEPPAALLSGGEATVTVTGDGTGGPNTEFALAGAIELPEGVALLSADTDGRDGGTDAAGAVVDGATVEDPEAARAALADNDAYTHLDARDALVSLDSTTNVNDLRVVLIEENQ